MASISVSVPVDKDWQLDDELELLIGSENAASLAASTPAGGTSVSTTPATVNPGGFGAGEFGAAAFGYDDVTPGFGAGDFGLTEFGENDESQRVLEHRYLPADTLAVLPVGVRLVDPVGNASALIETLVGLADLPQGASGIAVASTGNTNEARLTWTESPDV